MGSFTLPAFLFLAVVSSITLVCQGVQEGICQGSCPEGWIQHKGHCYQHVADKKTWLDAELNCLNLGGNLASEHSEHDHQFLKDLHKIRDPSNDPFWIGLSAVHEGRSWLWSDGTSASAEGDFSMWNPGEPNDAGGKEDCVHDNYGGQKHWNDVRCDLQYASICVLRTSKPACHDEHEIPPSNQPYVD